MRFGALLLIAGLMTYPLPRTIPLLALVLPLVPIGTALLFPATTSLMSRYSDPSELGTTMGVAQTFAGLARVAAPLLATIAFQRLGHGWPFYIAGGFVALVSLMAFACPPCAGWPQSPRKERPPDEFEERMDRLEHRLAVLETLVRQLAAPRGIPVGSAPLLDEVESPRPSPTCHRRTCPADAAAAAHAPAVVKGISSLTPSSGSASGCSWGSASQRCSRGGFSLQALVRPQLDHTGHALPWRCRRGRRGGRPRVASALAYRTYGAALIGAGAGIISLSVSAAAKLYGVMPSAPGIVGLALVSVALAMIAYAIDVEALGTAAALGAFMAPVLLGESRANFTLLLLYLASIAVGLGLVAARRHWRLTMLVVAASYFGVGIAGRPSGRLPGR